MHQKLISKNERRKRQSDKIDKQCKTTKNKKRQKAYTNYIYLKETKNKWK